VGGGQRENAGHEAGYRGAFDQKVGEVDWGIHSNVRKGILHVVKRGVLEVQPEGRQRWKKKSGGTVSSLLGESSKKIGFTA